MDYKSYWCKVVKSRSNIKWSKRCDPSKHLFSNSKKQKTVEWEDDMKAIIKCILWCYKSKSFTVVAYNFLI